MLETVGITLLQAFCTAISQGVAGHQSGSEAGTASNIAIKMAKME